LDDAFYQSERTRNVVETEKAVKAGETNITSDCGMEQNTLKLRAEIDFSILKTVVKRLDAHAVAGENETPFVPHPDRDREHSPQLREARSAPAQEGVEYD